MNKNNGKQGKTKKTQQNHSTILNNHEKKKMKHLMKALTLSVLLSSGVAFAQERDTQEELEKKVN